MPRLAPVRRTDLIFFLRRLGFDGPFRGGKHQYMCRGETRLILPNPHQGDIGVELLARILRQADISRSEWERL